MCGNHDVMAEEAREKLLTLDQEDLIRKYHLEADDKNLYLRVFHKPYQIDRQTGHIRGRDCAVPAPHNIAMAIYDMLCYSEDRKELPPLSGSWVTLSQLGGLVGAGHAKKLHAPEALKPFYDKVPELNQICRDLGGEEQRGGDVSYRIPVFDFFPLWFQYWDADDEFPANIQFLWDKNSLYYLHFEILYHLTLYLEDYLADAVKG